MYALVAFLVIIIVHALNFVSIHLPDATDFKALW